MYYLCSHGVWIYELTASWPRAGVTSLQGLNVTTLSEVISPTMDNDGTLQC